VLYFLDRDQDPNITERHTVAGCKCQQKGSGGDGDFGKVEFFAVGYCMEARDERQRSIGSTVAA
jgi:hypothetical protein